MIQNTLFYDLLCVLHVPCTRAYSNMRFRAYPAKLTFTALQDLLAEYGVLSMLSDDPSKDFSKLATPFVAETAADGYLIVTQADAAKVAATGISGKPLSFTADAFKEAWTGRALTVSPMAGAAEPDLKEHRRKQLTDRLMSWGIAACVLYFIVNFFIVNRIYAHWAWIVALAFYAAGIYVCRLLVLKESHVASAAADAMCGVIEKEGCSTVLATSHSSLFGMVPWCEIGLTFFSVSFMALLLFPQATAPYLAALSVACLPYTVWSVLTQKFKIHAWCTLCLTVQTLFWLLFTVWLLGRGFHDIVPLRWDVMVSMVAAYGLFLAVLHKLVPMLFHAEHADAEAARDGGSDSAASSSSAAPRK